MAEFAIMTYENLPGGWAQALFVVLSVMVISLGRIRPAGGGRPAPLGDDRPDRHGRPDRDGRVEHLRIREVPATGGSVPVIDGGVAVRPLA